MDHCFKRDTIKTLTELLIENYVFPEKAANLRSELTQRLNDRENEDINDHTLFAELLTSQLQNVSQDKHLQIRHSTEKPQVENTQKDNNVHHDNFLTMLRLDNYESLEVCSIRYVIGTPRVVTSKRGLRDISINFGDMIRNRRWRFRYCPVNVQPLR